MGGSMALFMPIFASGVAYTGVSIALGVLGFAGVLGTFFAEKGFRAKSLLIGITNLFLFKQMASNPVESLQLLTAVISGSCIADGVHETVFAIQNEDTPCRGWNFFSGLASVAVGVYAAVKMPISSLVVPGIALGVNLITLGAAKIAIALTGQDDANSRIDAAPAAA